jgi:hypothetical protein
MAASAPAFIEIFDKCLIPDCGDTDSSAAPSALEDGAYIPLDHRTFLQWMSQWPRTQHESGSASFGISAEVISCFCGIMSVNNELRVERKAAPTTQSGRFAGTFSLPPTERQVLGQT